MTYLQIGLELSGDLLKSSELVNDHFGAQDHVRVFGVLVVVIKDHNVTK